LKTGLGVYKKYRLLIAGINLVRFSLRKIVIGFDSANLFIQRADKYSVQLILRKNGAVIGRNCDIETGQVFHNCRDYSNLTVGNNCHIGKNCFFDLRDKVIIDSNVVISMKCAFITHIDMSRSELRAKYPAKSNAINIGHDSYIGVGTTVLMGVRIGNSSFITASSLITKDIDSFKIAGGIPARVIRSNTNENE
jgi:acetyltransferase-like isoleucine patch superfamily enzyme